MAIIVYNNLKKVHTLSLVDRCVYKSNRRLLHFNRTSSKYLTGQKNSKSYTKPPLGVGLNNCLIFPDHLYVTCKQGKRLIIIIYMYFERKQILIPLLSCLLCVLYAFTLNASCSLIPSITHSHSTLPIQYYSMYFNAN